MRWLFKPHPVASRQVVGKAPGKRVVAQHQLHLGQQRVGSGHLVPEGNGRCRIRDMRRHHATGYDVAQRIDEHQPFAALHQLARIESHRGPGRRGRVLDALRINYDAGRQRFLGAFMRQSTVRQAVNSVRVPSRSHLAKYQ